MTDYRPGEQTIDDLADFERSGGVQTREVDFARVCWILFWANMGLALFKIAVGAFGYSRLLVIDGLNSAANAVVITTYIFSIQMSHQETISGKYPYGKGKAQYLVTIMVGFLLAIGASLILALSVKTFFAPISLEPTGIALAAALISVGVNLLLLRFLKQTDLGNEKEALKKIGQLHSLNIATSTVVIQAVLLGGIFGWFVAERMGGVSISLLVLFLSIRIIRNSLDGIMDRSDGKEMDGILFDVVNDEAGVEKVKWVRARNVGQNLWVDVQVGLNGDNPIWRADQISERIRERISSGTERITHVTVHCDPV